MCVGDGTKGGDEKKERENQQLPWPSQAGKQLDKYKRCQTGRRTPLSRENSGADCSGNYSCKKETGNVHVRR